MSYITNLFCSGDPIYTVGQILGLVIAAISFFIYFSKKRRQILLTKLVTDVLNVIQLAMLGAFTGSLINGISIFREIVFYNRLRRKWASYKIWLLLFIVLMGASPILTWEGYISILPAVGSMLAVIGFYVQNPTHTRIIGIFAQGLWLIYCVHTGNVGATLQNVVLITAAIAGLIRDYIDHRKRSADDPHSISNQNT